MARWGAASAGARVAKNSGLANTFAQPAYFRLLTAEQWMQRAVPLLIAVFLAVVGAGAFVQMTGSRQDALKDRKADLDMIGTLMAARLNELSHQPAGYRGESAAFLLLIPATTLAYGRRIYIVDGNGRILHSSYAATTPPIHLEEVAPGIQPVLAFAERAGVLQLRLAAGGDALVTGRRLLNTPDGGAHVVVLQPVDAALESWRNRTTAIVILFITLGGVVAALGMAFYVATARAKHADQICSRMTARIDTALSEAKCGLWEWDIARGRFFWSDSMYQLIGLERTSEVLGFGEINELVNPEDGDLFALADRMMAESEQTAEHEFRMRHAAGHWVWLRARLQLMRDVDAARPRLIGVVVDVTEQKQFAEMTRRADVRLSDAINSISEAFVLWDHNNRLVLCNSKFRTLHSLAPEDVTPGVRFEALAAADGSGAMIGAPRPERGASRVYQAQLSDGRWLQVSERRTRDGGFVSVGTDITSHKDQEARLMDSERRLLATVADLRKSRRALQAKTTELEEAAAQLEQQKLEAETASRVKTDFLANMSHELKTPLNAIIGFSEMMEQRIFGELGSRHYEDYVGFIRRSGATLLTIINDILEMSRIEAGRINLEASYLSVESLVQSVVELVAHDAESKKIALTVETSEALHISADARAVRQALAQLLRNAVKFTPEGGQAAIRVRKAIDGVNIFVEDTGVGIPKEQLAKFGRPFEVVQGKLINGSKGSGLGVAIAKSLIELHGGGLRVRSFVNAGTIVMVHLPLAPEPSDELRREAA
jgi:two-component system cell cycle sensor histidine kinase PleC